MHGAIMEIQQVLEFWFGSTIDYDTPQKQAKLWWSKQKTIDQQIRRDFEDGLQALVDGDYLEWLQTARGRLAAIIVADQFSRNMYRDSPQAFAQDHVALKYCLDGLNNGQDLELKPIERTFFYLPLEHSEDLAMQDLSCRQFAQLLNDAPSSEAFRGFSQFAERHREVIIQFGRFPHRNALLGRQSTEEERQYLNTPGSGF
jgi:uncharacterized protein (DUF924 family)